jgi:hypothetical protein
VKKNIAKKLAKCKQKISKKLKKRNWTEQIVPMLKASNIQYEVDGRLQGVSHGGIGLIHMLAKKTGLLKEIDKQLELLKRHLPYHESDHVANMAYNILAGGTCLQDIELLRNDGAWLNALGAQIIPDPTTAGDFLRRFSQEDIIDLMDVKNTIVKGYGKSSRRVSRKRLSSILTEPSAKHWVSANKEWTSLIMANGVMHLWLFPWKRQGNPFTSSTGRAIHRLTWDLPSGWIKHWPLRKAPSKKLLFEETLTSASVKILTNGTNAVLLSLAWMPEKT